MKKIFFVFFTVAMTIFVFASLACADGWQLKDMGVGIYDDAAYDRELRIVERRATNTWPMKELMDRGAFRGQGKVFGVWLVGPPVNTYLNQNGVAEYGYKYRLTDPKGHAVDYGVSSFYMPGHATSFINAGLPGKWRVEFLLWHRSTGQVTPIGSLEFTITEEAKAPSQSGWQLKDMGVGIYDDAAYDRELRIVERRATNTWSMKELMDRGAFRGQSKVFGVWLVGPPVNTYLNQNGVAEYGYKHRLTDPKGHAVDYGVSSFYMPGHATSFINAGLPGKWRVEFLLWHRSTGQVTPIGSLEFTITE